VSFSFSHYSMPTVVLSLVNLVLTSCHLRKRSLDHLGEIEYQLLHCILTGGVFLLNVCSPKNDVAEQTPSCMGLFSFEILLHDHHLLSFYTLYALFSLWFLLRSYFMPYLSLIDYSVLHWTIYSCGVWTAQSATASLFF